MDFNEKFLTRAHDLSGADANYITDNLREVRIATIKVTSDKDFADQRSFPVGEHYGVIRRRVWPTTVEEIQNAIARLLSVVADSELGGALVIVGQHNIRIRASLDRRAD